MPAYLTQRAPQIIWLALAGALGLQASACAKPGPDPVEEGKRIQSEIRRAIITTKSLGRFGDFALLQEDLTKVPCEKPLSAENRDCEVQVIGKGRVRLRACDASLEATGRVMRDALVRVEYQADCGNQAFDFKTFDNVLPRAREQAPAGKSLWQDKLVKVTHWRLGEAGGEQCGVVVEVAPALLEEIRSSPSL